jgi:hypothetical protein
MPSAEPFPPELTADLLALGVAGLRTPRDMGPRPDGSVGLLLACLAETPSAEVALGARAKDVRLAASAHFGTRYGFVMDKATVLLDALNAPGLDPNARAHLVTLLLAQLHSKHAALCDGQGHARGSVAALTSRRFGRQQAMLELVHATPEDHHLVIRVSPEHDAAQCAEFWRASRRAGGGRAGAEARAGAP